MKKMIQEKNECLSERAYFSSPQNAVQKIAEMLKKSEFKALARYYDLTGSNIPLAELESGAFFKSNERHEISHPAGFSQYKHPFSPGFRYSDMQSINRDNVYLIRVTISIDQGLGMAEQEGYSLFYMIRSTYGWQVLPDPVEASREPAAPFVRGDDGGTPGSLS